MSEILNPPAKLVKVKISDATGDVLDYLAAKCMPANEVKIFLKKDRCVMLHRDKWVQSFFSPTKRPDQLAHFIDNSIDSLNRIRINADTVIWEAVAQGDENCIATGPDHTIATLRCVAMAKYGEFASVPFVLLGIDHNEKTPRVGDENFDAAAFEKQWAVLPNSMSLCELFGNGDPAFGGHADDRPVLVNGCVQEGSPLGDHEVAVFKTVAEAHEVAKKIPNRRPNSILGVTQHWNR